MKLLPRIAVVSALAVASATAQYGDDTSSTYSYSSTSSSSTDYSSSVSVDDERRFGLFAAFGYGFPVGGRHVADSDLLNPEEDEDHFLNYGQGIKVEGGVSFRFLENVRARFGFQFSGGVPRIERVEEVEIPALGMTRTVVDYRWSMFGIKALVAPRFEVFDLLDMYTGAGVGVFFTSSSFEVTQNDGDGAKGEVDNAPTVGFLGLFGIDFPIADNIMLFGELNLEAMRVATKKQRVYESDFGSGEFEDETEHFEDDVTDREPRPRTPGTNVALRAGVRFDLF